MNNNFIYNKFETLLCQEREEGVYSVISITDGCDHKIGCSLEGYPIIFIHSSDSTRTSDIKLELFHVMFTRECKIQNIGTNTTERKCYNVVQLNSNNRDLQRYFFDVMEILINRLGKDVTNMLLKSEIVKVIKLFTEASPLSMEVIRGLWAELLVIEQSNDPEYLIRSWHVTPNDKYDFNDGEGKIEVKSTASDERIHIFSIGQLNPDGEGGLLIASVIVSQIGVGKSIFDLTDSISQRIGDSGVIIKLREIVLSTIGPHIQEASKIFFDYNKGVHEYLLFDYKQIPSISIDNIPIEVTKVSFQSDLTNCIPVNKGGYNVNYKLYRSL